MRSPTKLPPPHPHRDRWAAAVLAGVAFAVFARALSYGFVTLDDPYYVFLNPHVLAGLNADTVRWAFTTFDNTNWHPLTWLSLQLDASLWGPVPLGFHLTNVLLHAANTALLFLALRALTGAYWRSAAVALLFAVHPLRVESVAWVTERKDVLSAFFGLLALWTYAGYVAAPSVRRYFWIALAMALSLLAKPMLVTLPFLLLVLDWWPLGRVRGPRDWPRLAAEKLPLVALAAASSFVTYWAQSEQGAVVGLTKFSAYARVTNAAVSYVQYLSKTFCPTGLAVYYPHPGAGLPAWQGVGAALFLAAVTAAAVVLWRRAPYVLAGWLWYLGTLVPVIGLVQVGHQAYADRYTYIPQIGILVALCWGVADLSTRHVRVALTALAVAAAALVFLTESQLAVWRDSLVLWTHAIRTAGKSPTALQSLARALEDVGRPDAMEYARRYYEESLVLEPDSVLGHTNLGGLLGRMGRLDEAVEHLKTACELEPKSAAAHNQLGNVYYKQGKLDDAIREQKTAIELVPQSYTAYCGLGQAEAARGDADEAIRCYREALTLSPDFAEAHNSLAIALLSQGEKEEAVEHLKRAIDCNPEYGEAHFLLGKELIAAGERGAGLAQLQEAVLYGPAPWDAHFELGKELEKQGAVAQAEKHFSEAVRLNENAADAWDHRGMARALLGDVDGARACLERALRLKPESDTYRSDLARILDGQAATRAAEGDAAGAAALARRARDLAAAAGKPELVRVIEEQLRRYERGETGRPPSKTVQ